jgi:hypothetical protein
MSSLSQAMPRERNGVPGHKSQHGGHESRGLARVFMSKIIAADEQAYRVAKDTFAIAKKGWTARTPKPGFLIAIARAWQQMPSTGSLARKVIREQGALNIAELRLSGGYLYSEDWDEGAKEHGLSLSILQVHVSKHSCTLQIDEQAFIGVHALSRWYQRNFDLRDEALLSDLGRLYVARQGLLDTKSYDFAVPTNEGLWLGRLCSSTRHSANGNTKEGVVLRVQTYSSEGFTRQ